VGGNVNGIRVFGDWVVKTCVDEQDFKEEVKVEE
jgi:hypothetical protein